MESYNSDVDNVTFNGTFNVDGTSISTSLVENVPNTDNGERTMNVINQNAQTIIPANQFQQTIIPEYQGEVGDVEVDRRGLSDQHIIERAIFFELPEQSQGGFRARTPFLNINSHKYSERNSTCPEMKEHCSICLEEYSDKEKLARIDYGHIYHIDCLKEWNMIENNCPMCKRKVAVICHLH